jgi:hypothetical protein
MIIGGSAWIAIMSTFNVAAQVTVPGWVRARALAVYGIVAQGGMAVGSAVWGLIAERVSLSMTLVLAAATLAASIAVALRYPMRFEETSDLTPSEHWPEPVFSTEPEPDAGPVLITVEYTVEIARAENFVTAMRAVRTQRLRDGAYRWGLYNDAAAPSRFVETFVVESWAEHVRQHGRVTVADRDVEEVARAFHVGAAPPVISHLIYARPTGVET